jgi:hypothetical protein
MANSQRPTQQTHHLDIKHFGLVDWVESDQLKLSYIQSINNPADCMTNILGPHLFSHHAASLLGKRKPSYCTF